MQTSSAMLAQLKSFAASRGWTLADLAREAGYSWSSFHRVAAGESMGSRRFWRTVIDLTGGAITPNDAMRAEIDAARSRNEQ